MTETVDIGALVEENRMLREDLNRLRARLDETDARIAQALETASSAAQSAAKLAEAFKAHTDNAEKRFLDMHNSAKRSGNIR